MHLSPEQRHADFQALLNTLNTEQREAVEHIEGPVLLLAGPGTGKTHVLAARIGKILLETDARPQNILCLTFTEAGVFAMRQRLLSMIGPEAYRVPIYTFHGFCNRVIQDNLEHFSTGEPEPLSDLERVEIIRTLLESMKPDHPLRAGKKAIFAYEVQLRNLFSTMKREGWKPGYVQKQIRIFLDSLPTNPEFQYQRNNKYGKKGEPKAAAVRDVLERMDLLSAAADLYPLYEKALRTAGRYEFEDMLLWVLRAFEQNEALLRTYQERFLYFLVDEYQDTNSAQYQLLQLLLGYWDNPNVFIVGDDDQSIFEFQGARLQNLVMFYRQYQHELFTRVLRLNYRSTQSILDASAALINNNTLRAIHALDLDLEKNLVAAQAYTTAPPQIRMYENRLQERSDTVDQITQLLAAGVVPTEIAVLYPQHRQAEPLLDLLQKNQIPYQTKRPVNILQLPLLRQFLDLLHYLLDEQNEAYSGDYRLFRLLHAPWWQLPAQDLARIALFIRLRADKGHQNHWREMLNDQLSLESCLLRTPTTALLDLGSQLNQWVSDGINLSPALLLESLMNKSGLLRFLLQHPDKSWWLQVFHTLLEFVQRESVRDPRFSLGRLLDMFGNMEANKIPLSLQQTLGQTAGVQLLSVHGAKGLEFDHVFLLDCTADYWEPSSRGQQQFRLPDTLLLTTAEEDAMEARRRLFYVAMTRAKKGLYLGCSRFNPEGKVLQPARFLAETELPEVAVVPTAEQLARSLETRLLEPSEPVITLPEQEQIDRVLKDFRMSISSLNRFLRCPLAFYYEDILQVPGLMSEPAAFGQAMHHAVQVYFLAIKNAKTAKFPDRKILLTAFQAAMEKRKAYFTAAGFEQRLALGLDFLDRYHHEQVPYWRRKAIAERKIDRVEVDGVPITGVLDKIEWHDDGSIRVLDYKTGSPNRNKVAAPSEKAPMGSEYWRQLVFYKILLENANIYPEKVRSAAIEWLEPDREGRFLVVDMSISAQDLVFVQHLLTESYQKIMEHAFTTGCQEPDCQWCQMHQNREIPSKIAREEEALDDLS
ncbi:MAG: ATP-dependent helicase [Lewinellaceae bacterium]|nr:ATP-dependent helicase [Lewinellaceae bacterium]